MPSAVTALVSWVILLLPLFIEDILKSLKSWEKCRVDVDTQEADLGLLANENDSGGRCITAQNGAGFGFGER